MVRMGLAGKRIFHIGSAMKARFSEGRPLGGLVFKSYGPIAQLDRVTDFYSVGCRFESCWDRQGFQRDGLFVLEKSVSRCVLKKTL
jgi:hypothetical protein